MYLVSFELFFLYFNICCLSKFNRRQQMVILKTQCSFFLTIQCSFFLLLNFSSNETKPLSQVNSCRCRTFLRLQNIILQCQPSSPGLPNTRSLDKRNAVKTHKNTQRRRGKMLLQKMLTMVMYILVLIQTYQKNGYENLKELFQK